MHTNRYQLSLFKATFCTCKKATSSISLGLHLVFSHHPRVFSHNLSSGGPGELPDSASSLAQQAEDAFETLGTNLRTAEFHGKSCISLRIRLSPGPPILRVCLGWDFWTINPTNFREGSGFLVCDTCIYIYVPIWPAWVNTHQLFWVG